MAQTYFEPGKNRAAKVNALFARIASRYDLINDLQSFGLHRRWKNRVVDLARPEPGQQALDLCCGTGDLAFALSRRGPAVTGLDFNEPMLGIAGRKQSKVQSPKSDSQDGGTNARGVRFVRGDALELPFRDRSFDIVTVGYGLRNLADWERGVSEMSRVAKPGGRLLVLDFGKPDNLAWRGIYFGYLRLFVPCLGLLFCGSASAYGYILESLKHYPAQHGVADRMRTLGLANVRIVNLLGGAMTINVGEKV